VAQCAQQSREQYGDRAYASGGPKIVCARPTERTAPAMSRASTGNLDSHIAMMKID